MNQTPQVACIGAGYWGKNLVRNHSALGSLRWICEADRGRHEELRQQYPAARITGDPAEVLADPEVQGVVIATPAETHGRLVAAAIAAGKDVFVEKPLCLSATEGEELVALARREGRILMVGHLLWYHPAVIALKQLISEGRLGRIEYVYSNRLNLGKIRREENILWSFAPHDISVILGLVGEMPENVSAQGGNYLHPQIADVTVSTMRFPSGVQAHVFVSWLHPFKEQKLVVVGERQMAVFDDLASEHKLVLYPHSIDWRDNQPIARKAEGCPVPLESAEPLRLECEHFLECIRTRSSPRTDGQEGLRVLRVLSRFQEALQQQSRTVAEAAPASSSPKPVTPVDPRAELGEGCTIHPTSWIDAGVRVGAGTSVWHFSHLLPGTVTGDNCRIGQNVVIGPRVSVGARVKIQNNVSVYEGVTLEDDVFCGPSMVFTNVYNPRAAIPRMHELRRTLVRQGATLGANCTVVCGVTIGRYAFVGAGAVVLKDVPDYALMVGNPARQVGWMCVCGERVDFCEDTSPGGCAQCGRRYSKTGPNTITPL